jgi:hypothetical protein
MNRNHLILLVFIIVSGCGGGITAYKISGYDALIKSGWAKYNKNNFDYAYKIFLDAKNTDSSRPEAYIGCGWSLFMRQHPDSALVDFYQGFDYVTAFDDSVDTICGVSGCYLALGENARVIKFLNTFDMEIFDKSFPLKDHDFFLDRSDLEMVLAQAYYRLGMYSSTESPDPNNAVFHLNQVLFTSIEYTTPDELMKKMTEYLSGMEGGFYQ